MRATCPAHLNFPIIFGDILNTI